jgi:hypothetical protein
VSKIRALASAGNSQSLEQALAQAERNAARQAQFDLNNARLPLSSAEANYGAPQRLAESIRNNGASGDLNFVRTTDNIINEMNNIRRNSGQPIIDNNQVVAFRGGINHLGKRVGEGMSPEDIAYMAADSLVNPKSIVLPARYENQMVASVRPSGNYNASIIGRASDGRASLKSVSNRSKSKIKNTQAELGSPSAADQLDGVTATQQAGSSSGQAVPPRTRVDSVAKNTTKVKTPKLENLSGLSIENPNLLTRVGRRVENTGEAIKTRGVYSKLDKRTAEYAARTDAPNRLSRLGYTPNTYNEASKVSGVVNDKIDRVINETGNSVIDNNLIQDLRVLPEDVTFTAPSYATKYKQIVDGIESNLQAKAFKNIGNPKVNEYMVGDMLSESRRMNSLIQQYAKKVDADSQMMADALRRVKYSLRDKAEEASMGAVGDKMTRDRLTQALREAGANQKTIKYITDYRDLSDLIKRTSLFETAGDMAQQMKSGVLKRQLNNGQGGGAVNRILDSSGVGVIADDLLEPVGNGAGRVIAATGRGLQKPGVQKALKYGAIGAGGLLGLSALGGGGNNQQPQTLENTLMQGARANALGAGAGGVSGQQMFQAPSTYPSGTYRPSDWSQSDMASVGGYTIEQLEQGYIKAWEAGDKNAATAIANMLDSAYDKQARLDKQMADYYESQKKAASGNKLQAGDRKVVQGIDSSINQLRSLVGQYERAGGGQGWGGGNLADLLGNFNINRNAADYQKQRQSLGTAIVKNFVNLGMTEADAKRYEAMLPNFSDTREQAANKFQTLYGLLEDYKQSVYDSYDPF